VLNKEEAERYSRHILIDKIGEKGQEKIKRSSVLVVGAGGLGSPILMYLVSSGVGRVGIVDGDIVSVSNLSRQVLYADKDVGKKKVFVAKEKLVAMNPFAKIDIYPEWLDCETAPHIFRKYDCIVDATDNFETRYLINRTAVELNKPLFIGAVGRFTGQAMVVIPHKSACYNCVFPEKEKETLHLMTQRNASLGVFSPLVGVIGTIVANEVLKYILGIGKNLIGKLLIYDALNNEFSIIPVQKDPNCKICGTKK